MLSTAQRSEKNAMNSILRVSPEPRVFNASSSSSGKNMVLRIVQKSMEWVVDLVFKFCKAKALVPDTCADTLVTGKTCLMLPEYCRFVGSEKSSTCFQNAMLSLVEINTKHILSSQSNIDETWVAVKARNILFE